MKHSTLQGIYWVVEHGDFERFGFSPEEPLIVERDSSMVERQAKCNAIADWLLAEGRAFGASFEYQGGSEIQAKFRAKAEELYRLFE